MPSRRRFRALLPVVVLASVLASVLACDEAAPTLPTAPVEPNLATFVLKASDNPGLTADVVGDIRGDTVQVVLPRVLAVTALVPRFSVTEAGTVVRVDTVPQRSGQHAHDFTPNVTYSLASSTGAIHDYVVVVTVFTGLPVVTVTTVGGAPILTREDYVNATVAIYGGKENPQFDYAGTTQIRGRGNSTWANPKKPYRLKLTTSSSLFGFPADRDWTLLANYWDPALVRNALAFQLSGMMSAIAYTPRCTPVEVVVNGVHQGAYQLCDHVEVATNRVPATSAGWFLEISDITRVDADETYFHTPAIDAWSTQSDPYPSVWIYKQPNPPTVAQRATVEGEMLRFEGVLYGEGFADPDTGYAKYLDVDPTIDWFIVQELSKNNDAAFFNSVYAYKAPIGKIIIGPLWDFDLAFGNYPFDFSPTGWKIRNAAWVARLFEDRAFIERLKVRWQLLYSRRAQVDAFIVNYTRALEHSQRRTHAMWFPYDPTPLLLAGDLSASIRQPRARSFAAVLTDAYFPSEVNRVRDWLNARWSWLNTNINDL